MPLADISPWLDWGVEPVATVRARLAAQDHRRIIKTHTPLDGLPLDPRVTYVVVGRHPLDVAVSLYHHARNIDRARVAELSGRPRQSSPSEPIVEFVRTWMDPPDPPSEQLDTLPGLVHHLADAWERHHDADVVLVHFQDLVDDTAGSMRTLAARLGIDVPEDRGPPLVEAASFEAMKRRADWLAPDRLGVVADRTAFFRSGRSGEGRDLLDAGDLDHYHYRVRALAPPDLLAWLHRAPSV